MKNYKNFPLWKKVEKRDWENWKWQIRNVITGKGELEKVIKLSKEEKEGIRKASKYLKMRITPYIASLMDYDNPKDPLRLQFIPSFKEIEGLGEKDLYNSVNDDDKFMSVDGLVHRYPTKVLILPSDYCGCYCRYCFRRKFVGEKECSLGKHKYKNMFTYVERHKLINEVILSGGDPLVLDDEFLEYILGGFKKIKNVKIMRIHTRIPVTIPYRITSKLISVLRRYKPIYMVIHIDTPREISPQMKTVISKLVDNGIPCLSSCPLLKGINDNPETLKELFTQLVEMRVKPYYLFHSDPVKGLKHFLVPLENGVKIMKSLYDNMSGLAMPSYCFNVPGGGGHSLVDYNFFKKLKKGTYEITTFEGKKFIYKDLGK